MPTTSDVSRPLQLHRSWSWPHPSYTSRKDIFLPSFNGPARRPNPPSSSSLSRPAVNLFDPGDFEHDLDRNPDAHFLSPMDPHDEYWLEWSDEEDDSDSEDEGFQWNAGITDFTLFQRDRRAAAESQEHLSPRWENLISSQESALKRAEQRSNAPSRPPATGRPRFLRDEDVPDLTPDNSPDLRQALEDAKMTVVTRRQAPSQGDFLQAALPHSSGVDRRRRRFSSSDLTNNDGDDDEPLSFSAPHRQSFPPSKPKLQRPGIRGTRTMSGRVHAWRPPSWYIATVNEEPDAEARADAESGHD